MIRKHIFYSGPLRVVVVGYLKFMNQFAVLICFGIINNMTLDEESQEESTVEESSIPSGVLFALWCMAVIFLLLWPIWSIWFILRNQN